MAMSSGPQLQLAGERTSGQDVRTQNATAVLAVANILKTSLGPVGLDKARGAAGMACSGAGAAPHWAPAAAAAAAAAAASTHVAAFAPLLPHCTRAPAALAPCCCADAGG